jgi:hypothetical protein
MKNLFYFKNYFLASLLIFISSCETNEGNSNHQAFPEERNQSMLKYSEELSISDLTGENSIKIKIQSDNEIVIQDIKKTRFELVTLKTSDPILENDSEVPNFQTTNQNQEMDRVRLTILQQHIKPDVIAFSIKPIQVSLLLEERKAIRLIQTEFIAPYASIGGYVQAYFNSLGSKNNFKVLVENREDPEHSPAISILKGSPSDPLLITGFTDPLGIARLWRVRVIHESGVFPLVFWTGSLSI